MHDDELRASVIDIVDSIWGNTLMLPVGSGDPARVKAAHQRTFAGVVQITGAWDGAVAIQCTDTLARRASVVMLGLTEPQVTLADIQDTLGELANMAGGNLKAMLPEPCSLGLPVVVEGQDFRLRLPGSQEVTQCTFESENEPFTVTVLRRVPVAAPL